MKDGFIFSIQIFAPVIVIAAFFFLGSHDFACKVLGPDAPSILSDISLYLSAHVPMNKGMIILIELFIGFLTGLDGSGFSGLPLVGSVATTFAQTTGLNAATLAALGQITTIWVGGGTIIPWAVVPVAAICNVPRKARRKKSDTGSDRSCRHLYCRLFPPLIDFLLLIGTGKKISSHFKSMVLS